MKKVLFLMVPVLGLFFTSCSDEAPEMTELVTEISSNGGDEDEDDPVGTGKQ